MSTSKHEKGPATIIAEFEQGFDGQMRTSRMLFDYADALRVVGRRSDASRVYGLIDLSTVPEPKRWLVHLYRGQLHHDAGRFMEAESFFRSAIAENPESTVPWVFLAGAPAQQEKFEDAIAVLAGAVDLDGDRDEVYLNIGHNLRTLGRLEEALEYLTKALAITPDYPEALEAIADVNAALGLIQPKQGA